MKRTRAATVVVGLLSAVTGAWVLLIALGLGFYVWADPIIEARVAKAHTIATPAGLAVVAGLVALAGRRHRWGLVVGCVGGALAALAVVLTATIHTG